jgi:hypothetical protein
MFHELRLVNWDIVLYMQGAKVWILVRYSYICWCSKICLVYDGCFTPYQFKNNLWLSFSISKFCPPYLKTDPLPTITIKIACLKMLHVLKSYQLVILQETSTKQGRGSPTNAQHAARYWIISLKRQCACHFLYRTTFLFHQILLSI